MDRFDVNIGVSNQNSCIKLAQTSELDFYNDAFSYIIGPKYGHLPLKEPFSIPIFIIVIFCI